MEDKGHFRVCLFISVAAALIASGVHGHSLALVWEGHLMQKNLYGSSHKESRAKWPCLKLQQLKWCFSWGEKKKKKQPICQFDLFCPSVVNTNIHIYILCIYSYACTYVQHVSGKIEVKTIAFT